jgi:hypothetical protein
MNDPMNVKLVQTVQWVNKIILYQYANIEYFNSLFYDVLAISGHKATNCLLMREL